MPRSEERRVQALLNGAWNRREVRTASHTSVVIEALVVGPRAPGRPRDSIVLMNDGELTRAGRIYERLTGERVQPPAAWSGEPYLVGNNQWINTVDGTARGRKLLSTFVRGKEKLTNWGKRWYRENPEEYIVHVPVRITYVRKDKSH